MIKIRKYKYEKVEIESKEIELPIKPSYYFETGIRRSIKIVPEFDPRPGKENELYQLKVVCLHSSFQCRAEMFTIQVSDIEKFYYSENKNDFEHDFVKGLVDGYFQERTEEQFDADFEYVYEKMKLSS